jgi:antitoxin HigA-1
MFRATCPVTRLSPSSFWRSSFLPGLQCCFIDEPRSLPASFVEKVRDIWRIIFAVDEKEGDIVDLDFEDYRHEFPMRIVKPAHPGRFIKMEIVDPHRLTVIDAGKALGVTRAALSALFNGRAAQSAEIALQIEKAFGVSMDTLLRMQTSDEPPKSAKPRASASSLSPPNRWWRESSMPAIPLG